MLTAGCNDKPSGIFMANSIKLNVFGRMVMAERAPAGWRIFYVSPDGKRRPADDIPVPDFVTESELMDFIADLCHEWATEKHSGVLRID